LHPKKYQELSPCLLNAQGALLFKKYLRHMFHLEHSLWRFTQRQEQIHETYSPPAAGRRIICVLLQEHMLDQQWKVNG
jgi:hypothetical protein